MPVISRIFQRKLFEKQRIKQNVLILNTENVFGHLSTPLSVTSQSRKSRGCPKSSSVSCINGAHVVIASMHLDLQGGEGRGIIAEREHAG